MFARETLKDKLPRVESLDLFFVLVNGGLPGIHRMVPFHGVEKLDRPLPIGVLTILLPHDLPCFDIRHGSLLASLDSLIPPGSLFVFK